MLFSLMAAALIAAAGEGCTKDIECKGERICVEARCVDPPNTTRGPATAPILVRKKRLVADFAALGGVSVFVPVAIAPAVTAHVMLGGRLTDHFAIGAVFNEQLLIGARGMVLTSTLSFALSFGGDWHTNLSLGPTLVGVFASPGGFGLGGSFVLHGVFAWSNGFGIHTQLAVVFDSSAVLFSFSLGIGGSSR